jgi:hypothetical protein
MSKFYYYISEPNYLRKLLRVVEACNISEADMVFCGEFKIDPWSPRSSIVVTLEPIGGLCDACEC